METSTTMRKTGSAIAKFLDLDLSKIHQTSDVICAIRLCNVFDTS